MFSEPASTVLSADLSFTASSKTPEWRLWLQSLSSHDGAISKCDCGSIIKAPGCVLLHDLSLQTDDEDAMVPVLRLWLSGCGVNKDNAQCLQGGLNGARAPVWMS